MLHMDPSVLSMHTKFNWVFAQPIKREMKTLRLVLNLTVAGVGQVVAI
jgi:hypothetical protein